MIRTECADLRAYKQLSTKGLREAFLLDGLFQTGRGELVLTDLDRAIVGSFVPLGIPLELPGGKAVASRFLLERREAGILNLGGRGLVRADGALYELEKLDSLYLGRGTERVSFESCEPGQPAAFYLVSYPAHAAYPSTYVPLSEAHRTELGQPGEACHRTIHRCLHPDRLETCQLTLGFTQVDQGGLWNTFPPHTHDRRTEIYGYFDLPADGLVLHVLGEPQETRHLIVREKELVLSPSWSIHMGVGTGPYRFAWAMGGENQVFEDMDPCTVEELR